MKKRNLKYQINWRDAWNEMRKERMKKPRISYDKDFFKKTAQDFSMRIKSNNYEFGRKTTEILSEILADNFEVLEIGTGPGTLTIPMSKIVKSIVGIEFSKINAKNLMASLEEEKLDNIEIVNKDWKEVDDDEIKCKFDLVVCSHFLWQVDDVERLLERMENASKKYCAVIQPCGRDEIVKEMFERLTNQKYTGQFEPDADYFAYVILREWGRLVNVKYFDYTHERNLEEEIRYIADFNGKFMEIDKAVNEMIEKYLLEKKEGAMYREKSSAVVLWWVPEI